LIKVKLFLSHLSPPSPAMELNQKVLKIKQGQHDLFWDTDSCPGMKKFRKYLVSCSFSVSGIIILHPYSWSNISGMRRSVSSPDETPRRALKIWRAAKYFWRTLRCFIWWWNTLCWMLDITSQTKWFWKEKLRIQKRAVFHLISKHSFKHQFPLNCLYEVLMSLRKWYSG